MIVPILLVIFVITFVVIVIVKRVKENIKEVKIFKDKEGKVKAYVRWGDEERTGTFPDFLLAMYWAEDFLYGENRDLEGECE